MRVSLNRGLLAWLGQKGTEPRERGRALCALLEANDFSGFGETLRAWLAGIPYQWHAKGDLARYEAWYASLLYMCLRAVGVDLRLEQPSARGRADMVLLLGGQVFVLEFKMAAGEDGSAVALDATIAQMRERGYAEQCREHDGPVRLLGMERECDARTGSGLPRKGSRRDLRPCGLDPEKDFTAILTLGSTSGSRIGCRLSSGVCVKECRFGPTPHAGSAVEH